LYEKNNDACKLYFTWRNATRKLKPYSGRTMMRVTITKKKNKEYGYL